ncbi:YkvA family protein [Acidiluteibacter ferrifornacis]|uniref:DUF1232 domain-containing protein n=1 Tax=Acidiluteibacter ferrifornacis TaxID=2692424 RepID=A0A6N9NKN0_9FLAO|nr:DUF1232 domain-containing protein [Acidiluteibacter ferrifornacis]NBG65717.1 DUF1232 domain-containing protein [Acidiluteibacter ferrifornacis]
MIKLKEKVNEFIKRIKHQLLILHLSYSDSRIPTYSKFLIFLTLAYALSPIDLIPDFIPILGLLDDLLILPIGIYFSIKTIPKAVIETSKKKAEKYKWNKKKSLYGVLIVLAIWIGMGFLFYCKYY